MKTKTEIFNYETCMGRGLNSGLPFLTLKQEDELSTLGYTGKLNGKRISFQDYLNGLKDGWDYLVQKTKWDNGDFCEAYTITRSRSVAGEKHITVQPFKIPPDEFGYTTRLEVVESDHPKFTVGSRFDFGFHQIASNKGYTILYLKLLKAKK